MYLQEVKKSTLSIFDDKRNYSSDIKSFPWNSKNKILHTVFI